MTMKCPCKGCPKRTLTCHSVCTPYEDWKIERAAINDWNREKNRTLASDAYFRLMRRRKKYDRGKVGRTYDDR